MWGCISKNITPYLYSDTDTLFGESFQVCHTAFLYPYNVSICKYKSVCNQLSGLKTYDLYIYTGKKRLQSIKKGADNNPVS